MNLLKLEDMTLEQKIGQLICVRGIIDEEDKEFITEMLKKRAVGGIQGIRGEDNTLKNMTLELADYPVLICADMEGGVGSVYHPRPFGVASTGDPKIAYELGRATAIEAKRLGINLIWGPMVDLLDNSPRTFGCDKDVVSEYAVQFVKGYQDEGLVCTAKHFIGAKGPYVDTHMKKQVSERTYEDLVSTEMVPFIRCMKEANLTGIMTRHTQHKNVDDKYVSSLSKKIIDMIRNEGFDGLIVTDSLAMMGIIRDYGEEHCLGLAIAAGNDMVLPNYRLSFKTAYNYLMKSYEKGVFSEERLNDAVRHVLAAQEKTLKQPTMKELDESLRNTIEESWAKSIVGIFKDGVSPALSSDTKKLFVLFCENEYPDIVEDSAEVSVGSVYSRQSREAFAQKILKEFPDSECMIINEWSHKWENEKLCVKCTQVDEVIFFTFAASAAYLGTNCISERVKALIEVNSEKISTVIHNGNPYEIEKFANVGRIYNYIAPGIPDKYLLKALKGEFIPTGKLPVEINI